MSRIVSFGTLKGGVGKTSLTCNIAAILAEEHKVLVIDLDAQTNATSNLGVDWEVDNTIMDVFDAAIQGIAVDPNSLIIKSPIEKLPNLDLIPSNIYLVGAELRVVSLSGRETIIKDFIEDNPSIFNKYEYIVMDHNPSLSIINQNGFFAADEIILVSEPSKNSLKGAIAFIDLWTPISARLKKKKNINTFVVNRVDSREPIGDQFIEYCKEHEILGELICDTIIPKNVDLAKAELANEPVTLFNSKATSSAALRELVRELKNKGVL